MFDTIFDIDSASIIVVALVSLGIYLMSLAFSRRTSIVPIMIAAFAGAAADPSSFAIDLGISSAAALLVALLSVPFHVIESKVLDKKDRHLLETLHLKWTCSVIALVIVAVASVWNLRTISSLVLKLASAWPVLLALMVGVLFQASADSSTRRVLRSPSLSYLVAVAVVLGVSPIALSPALMLFAGMIAIEVMDNERVGAVRSTLELLCSLALLPALAFLTTMLAFQLDTFWVVLIPVVLMAFLYAFLRYANLRRDSSRTGSLMRVQAEEMDENRRKLYELEVGIIQKERDDLVNLLDLRRNEVTDIAEKLTEQREFMQELYNIATEAEVSPDIARKDALLHEILSRIDLRLNFSDERDDLNSKVEELHKDFSVRLQVKYPQLSPQERRLAALLRLEFPTKYIATVLNISPKSVEIERHRLRQKFGLDRKERLTEFIKTI